MSATAQRPALAKPPPWRDVRVLRVVAQVVVVAAVAGLLYYLYSNLVTNLRSTGLTTGYRFLDQPFGADIPGCAACARRSVRSALVFGYINTVRVTAVGVVLATLLGIVIGVGRLSPNLFVRKASALYVDTIRNIPVFLIIFLLFFAVITTGLPPITEAIEWLGLVVFSNRGLHIPWFETTANVGGFLAALGVGLAFAVALGVYRTRRFDRTGQPHHRVLWAVATVVAVAAIGWFLLGGPVTFELPVRDGRRVEGGIEANTSFAGLLVALVLYTASHIAEIVRGSIQAVPKGQSEAATALGLSNFQRLRYVVLPQAFRIMVPPLANQFLNLTKNSSLAVAIGFYEITRVTQTAANNAAPAPQAYSILMLLYLSFSLSFSLVANIVNRRLRLETR